nr:hypothetical protein [Tanacetum cinerariifolium]
MAMISAFTIVDKTAHNSRKFTFTLSPTNYGYRKTMIEPFLITNNLIGYVDGLIPSPSKTLSITEGVTIPKENPNYQIQGYAPHSTSREYTLKTQLLRIEMHSDETLDAYLNRTQEYTNSLAVISKPVKDKDLVMLVVSDTRVNNHVTPDLEAMDSSEAYYGDHTLHVGNEKGLPILHIGSSKPLELMLSKRSRKNSKCVNAVDEELTAAKHKLMLLPMKKNDQIELDAEYARKLHEEIIKDHEEINKDIDWDAVINHVKQKSKENHQYIKQYQVMKKRPHTESEARKNMMVYLKNTAGYKLDFFKGTSYDEIRPIFQARFDANMRFLLKSREEMEEEDREVLKSINETLTQKATKRRKLNEEAQEVEDLKKHFEVVNDEDDDVFIEATPLARKNFDREDLEDLWRIVKERFSTSKPSNFFDKYLLTTLKTMFEKPDGQDAVWKIQRSVHGQELLLELMLSKRSRKNTKCVNAADEELTVAKHKFMLLVYYC